MKVNYCTETGIDFSIYFQQDFATIVVPHEGQMEPLLKSDLEEMSGAARIKGINAVFLETNYGLEIHTKKQIVKYTLNRVLTNQTFISNFVFLKSNSQ